MVDYIGRRYRFATRLREIKKGRPQQVVALHEDGLGAKEIRARTGSPQKTIAAWIAAYEGGREDGEASEFIGAKLGSAELCRLLGAVARSRR